MAGEIDEVTLARARRGDSNALSSLVRHYQRPVYALVGRLLVGPAAAARDDIAQEAFIRGVRGLPRFGPAGGAELVTWILTVTTRACLNAIRDGRRAAAVQPAPGPAVAAADPEREA